MKSAFTTCDYITATRVWTPRQATQGIPSPAKYLAVDSKN